MNYYLEENIIKTEEHLHDQYKLIIKTYDTSKVSGRTTWAYTEGFIYFNNQLVGSIKRNYSSFPFCFFGKYLISGSIFNTSLTRSYMKQTIIHCETGQIYDNTDDPSSDDFCWSDISLMNQTLIVYGCYWGASYEYKFFDISNVENGWPELKIEDEIIKKEYLDYPYSTEHTINDNILTIIYFEDYEDDNPIVDITIKLHRQDNMIKLINVILSEKEKLIIDAKQLKKSEEDKKITALRNNNLFYLNFILKVNDLGFSVKEWIYLHNNKFHICISYKKIKSCILEFNNIKDLLDSDDITFNYYDWKNNTNLSFMYTQDVSNIDEIINKIKALLI